jgi:hypothetical protein
LLEGAEATSVNGDSVSVEGTRAESNGFDGNSIPRSTALGLKGYIPQARNPLCILLFVKAISQEDNKPGKDH